MQFKDFYLTIARNEENAPAVLREHGLLDTVQETLPCHKCDSEMVDVVFFFVILQILYRQYLLLFLIFLYSFFLLI